MTHPCNWSALPPFMKIYGADTIGAMRVKTFIWRHAGKIGIIGLVGGAIVRLLARC